MMVAVIWPALIAHADWGTDRRKRQVAVAVLTRAGSSGHGSRGDGSGSYVVESLAPAVDGPAFFSQLRAAADPGQAMAGFDAVVGLLGMIAVVTGAIDAGVPSDDPAVISTEGWILGRAANGPPR